MNIEALFTLVNGVLVDNLKDNPLIVLQAAGLIGLLSTLLIFRGTSIVSSHLGMVFGGINLLMFALLEGWFQGPIKPFLRNDLLFLAGFFGGWRHATSASLLTLLGRAIFGGAENLLTAAIDILLIAYGGAFLKTRFKKNKFENISNGGILKLILCRVFVVTLPPILLYLAALSSETMSVNIIVIRITSNFSISVIVTYAVIFLLRREFMRERQLYVDHVTSLPNRRALQQDIAKDFIQSQQQKNCPSQTMLLIEIDNLNELIQEHDHDWADRFLKRFAKGLGKLSEDPLLAAYHPSVYCFSDHSFVLLLQGVTMRKMQRMELAQILHGRLLLIDHEHEDTLRARPMIGVIDVEFDESFTSSWFLRALNAMEKHSYSPVHYFESTITRQIQLDRRLRLQIEHWIAEGDVPLWLQPKMSLSGNYCIGAEALLRAQDSGLLNRYIPPPHVLSIAVKYHLLSALEWAIMQTAVKQLKQLPEGCQDLKFSVNISPASLTEPGFSKKVCDLLSQHDIAGERLTIEVIETSQLTISEAVQGNIAILTEYGVSLSLDDFGSGYASLSLLAKLPFNELKLDYAMISSLDNPRTHAAIMLSIEGAKRYSANIVAEGVETEKQRLQLIRMGIMQGQGFLFARAMPFKSFVEYAQTYSKEQMEQGETRQRRLPHRHRSSP